MFRLLIAIAALVAISANADIKREDYASYEAYLAAKSAQTAAEMDEELKPEPAPESEDRKVASDSAEARDDDQNRRAKQVSFHEEDKEAKTITIWHTFKRRGICTLIINGETVGSKELRDGEKWIYKYEIEGTFKYSHSCQGVGDIVASRDERNRLVLKNVDSKLQVCRLEMDYRPTQDYVIPPDMTRAMETSGIYRWHCHAGTKYKGYIKKREG